jgi:hypothetical protein
VKVSSRQRGDAAKSLDCQLQQIYDVPSPRHKQNNDNNSETHEAKYFTEKHAVLHFFVALLSGQMLFTHRHATDKEK